MSLPQGINFRTTVPFVTDGANEDPEATASGGGATYPRTTAQGNTVGWEGAGTIVTRDRSSTIDRRLAGLNGNNDASGTVTYRIDLPSAGSYQLNWASGDGSYASGSAVDLYDGASRLRALSTGVTSGAGKFKDATDTERLAAFWPTDNVAITAVFATTILRLTNVPNGSNVMCFTHVNVAASAGKRFFLIPG